MLHQHFQVGLNSVWNCVLFSLVCFSFVYCFVGIKNYNYIMVEFCYLWAMSAGGWGRPHCQTNMTLKFAALVRTYTRVLFFFVFFFMKHLHINAISVCAWLCFQLLESRYSNLTMNKSESRCTRHEKQQFSFEIWMDKRNAAQKSRAVQMKFYAIDSIVLDTECMCVFVWSTWKQLPWVLNANYIICCICGFLTHMCANIDSK